MTQAIWIIEIQISMSGRRIKEGCVIFRYWKGEALIFCFYFTPKLTKIFYCPLFKVKHQLIRHALDIAIPFIQFILS